MSSFSESHTSHGRVRHQIRDWSESGRSRELLTPDTSDSCRPRGVVTRDFSAIFDRLFDLLPVRISTSDPHHWILRKKIFHIRAYDFGVQFSFNLSQQRNLVHLKHNKVFALLAFLWKAVGKIINDPTVLFSQNKTTATEVTVFPPVDFKRSTLSC